MTLKAKLIILRNKYNNIDTSRKMYIEKNLQEIYTEQHCDWFISKLNDDERSYAFEFVRIVTKINLQRLRGSRK